VGKEEERARKNQPGGAVWELSGGGKGGVSYVGIKNRTGNSSNTRGFNFLQNLGEEGIKKEMYREGPRKHLTLQ